MSFWNVTLSLLNGALYTLQLFFVTLLFAIPLGFLVVALARSKFKVIRVITKTFIWVIRGTPLMLQIFVVFYVPGLLFGVPFESRLVAVAFAFVINYSAYFAEIYRGGIESVAVGQYEACKVLGMTKAQTNMKIVLPQVIKNIMPSMGNEVITLVKDTSLANVIGVVEIIMAAKDIVATKAIIWPLFYTGVFYLVMSGVLTLVLRHIEKKLSYYR